jgi:hypothetical protein
MVMSKDMGGLGAGGRGGRSSGGITGKGGVNVNPKYKEVGPSVSIVKPGTKPLTIPDQGFSARAPRSPDQLKRMGL